MDKVLRVNVAGSVIEETKSEKLLGIIVSNNMTFKQHLYGEQWRANKEENNKGLIPQLAQRIGILRKVVNLMPAPTFKSISQGLFDSKLV